MFGKNRIIISSDESDAEDPLGSQMDRQNQTRRGTSLCDLSHTRVSTAKSKTNTKDVRKSQSYQPLFINTVQAKKYSSTPLQKPQCTPTRSGNSVTVKPTLGDNIHVSSSKTLAERKSHSPSPTFQADSSDCDDFDMLSSQKIQSSVRSKLKSPNYTSSGNTNSANRSRNTSAALASDKRCEHELSTSSCHSPPASKISTTSSRQRPGAFDEVSKLIAHPKTSGSAERTDVINTRSSPGDNVDDSPIISANLRKRLSLGQRQTLALHFDSDEIENSTDDELLHGTISDRLKSLVEQDSEDDLSRCKSWVSHQSSVVQKLSNCNVDSGDSNISDDVVPSHFQPTASHSTHAKSTAASSSSGDIHAVCGSVTRMSALADCVNCLMSQLNSGEDWQQTSSQKACVCLQKLDLDDVPVSLRLSNKDRMLLTDDSPSSTRASSCGRDAAGSSSACAQTRTGFGGNIVRMSDVGVNCTEAALNETCCLPSDEDLFSDDELPSAANNSELAKCAGKSSQDIADIERHNMDTPLHHTTEGYKGPELMTVSQPLANIRPSVSDISVVNHSASHSLSSKTPPHVPFVAYSQVDDDCIIIDDSDDEIFANLTQNDISSMIEQPDDNVADGDVCRVVDDDDDNWKITDMEKTLTVQRQSSECRSSTDVDASSPVHGAGDVDEMWNDDLTADDLDRAYSSVMDPMADQKLEEAENSCAETEKNVAATGVNEWSDDDNDLILLDAVNSTSEEGLLCDLRPSHSTESDCQVIESVSWQSSDRQEALQGSARQEKAGEQLVGTVPDREPYVCLERLPLVTSVSDLSVASDEDYATDSRNVYPSTSNDLYLKTAKFYGKNKWKDLTDDAFDDENDHDNDLGSDDGSCEVMKSASGTALDVDSEMAAFYGEEIGIDPELQSTVHKRRHASDDCEPRKKVKVMDEETSEHPRKMKRNLEHYQQENEDDVPAYKHPQPAASTKPQVKMAQMLESRKKLPRKDKHITKTRTPALSYEEPLSQISLAKKQLHDRMNQLKASATAVRATRDYSSLAKNKLLSDDLTGAIEAADEETAAAGVVVDAETFETMKSAKKSSVSNNETSCQHREDVMEVDMETHSDSSAKAEIGKNDTIETEGTAGSAETAVDHTNSKTDLPFKKPMDRMQTSTASKSDKHKQIQTTDVTKKVSNGEILPCRTTEHPKDSTKSSSTVTPSSSRNIQSTHQIDPQRPQSIARATAASGSKSSTEGKSSSVHKSVKPSSTSSSSDNKNQLKSTAGSSKDSSHGKAKEMPKVDIGKSEDKAHHRHPVSAHRSESKSAAAPSSSSDKTSAGCSSVVSKSDSVKRLVDIKADTKSSSKDSSYAKASSSSSSSSKSRSRDGSPSLSEQSASKLLQKSNVTKEKHSENSNNNSSNNSNNNNNNNKQSSNSSSTVSLGINSSSTTFKPKDKPASSQGSERPSKNSVNDGNADSSSSASTVTLSSFIDAQLQKSALNAKLPATLPVPEKVKAPTVRFEDIVLPSAHLPLAKTEPSQPVNVDNFLLSVLSWNPQWLHEYAANIDAHKTREVPPVVPANQVFPLLETYDSYDDYFRIVRPLLLLDTWESVFQEWRENRYRRQGHQVVAVHLGKSADNKIIDLTCQAIVYGQGNVEELREGDLVIITLRKPLLKSGIPQATSKSPELPPEKPVFGHISRIQKFNMRNNEQLVPLIKDKLRTNVRPNVPQHAHPIVCCIQLYSRKYPIDNQCFMNVMRIGSLVTMLRQFRALINLPRNMLARDVLRPVNKHVFLHLNSILQVSDRQGLNASQVSAISNITNAVCQPYASPKICLLQGPPGTGKSQTIIGLVDRILAEKNSECNKILLCAPSNAGIDELCRRLKSRNVQLAKQARPKIKFVRVGNMSSVHDNVKDCGLPAQAKLMFEKSQQPQLTSVNRALKELDKKLNELSKRREICVSKKNADEIGQIDSDIALAKKRKTAFTPTLKPMTPGEEQQMKYKVLTTYNVICTTLNHSGANFLLDALRPQMDSNGRKTVHFGCIIVDEACQCTEIDCLIPLQYLTTKLVLVGDPEQLPPTVLSQSASEKLYGQSLFERFYSQFKTMQTQSPVMLLTTQYRMHSDICHFPNQHVYHGRLETDREVAIKRKAFPFAAYTLFDVIHSTEETDPSGTSVFNPQEAEVTCLLCAHIGAYMKPRNSLNGIGIITPYQRQRKLLVEKLQARNLSEIEVGTVDGFQGREKDVIILTCVRSNRTNNIGFLGDRRRLNVSLTRARYALYVVGNLQTLQRASTDWSALVSDAARRNRIVQIPSMQAAEQMIQKGCDKAPRQPPRTPTTPDINNRIKH